MAEDDRAIVVGISHYPALGHLAGPENDARTFAEWLRSPAEGNVPAGNVRLILSSDYPMETDPLRAKPTAEDLKKAIDELYDLGDKHGGHAGRRLYVFMAGHGFAADLDDVALLMANAARGRTGHHFRVRPYADWFRHAAFFEEVVLFMDCCREDWPSPLQMCHLEPVTGLRLARYYYGLATDTFGVARERADANGVVRGDFTTALLAGLREGPPSGGDVTGSWLEAFVFNYMPRLAVGLERQEPERQEPKFYYDHDNDIVFARRDAAVFHLRVRVGQPDEGRAVEMFDGSLRLLPPRDRSGGMWEWELGPGLYKYGYIGGPYEILELIGEGRVIDVPL